MIYVLLWPCSLTPQTMTERFRNLLNTTSFWKCQEVGLTLSFGKGALLWFESGMSPTGSCFKDLVLCWFDYSGDTVELWGCGQLGVSLGRLYLSESSLALYFLATM